MRGKGTGTVATRARRLTGEQTDADRPREKQHRVDGCGHPHRCRYGRWAGAATPRALLDIGHHTNIRAVQPVARCSSSLSWLKTCVPVGPLYNVEGKACNSRNKRAGSSVHSEGKVRRVSEEPCRPFPYPRSSEDRTAIATRLKSDVDV